MLCPPVAIPRGGLRSGISVRAALADGPESDSCLVGSRHAFLVQKSKDESRAEEDHDREIHPSDYSWVGLRYPF